MSKRKSPPRAGSTCPITLALDIFGDKWSLLLLRDMLFKGKQHYGEFLDSAEKISTNILADRLARLEAEGLISKTPDARNLSKYVYRLTQKGRDLLPMLLEMIAWSVQYHPQSGVPDNIITGAPANLLERARHDREALVAEILSRLGSAD